jgi:hypothetical protein
MDVMTEITKRIVFEALSIGNKDLNPWPSRVTWKTDKPQAKAILGTTHGKGVVWLLAQHKEQLDWKTITAMTVFANDDVHQNPLNILFTLASHPDAVHL